MNQICPGSTFYLSASLPIEWIVSIVQRTESLEQKQKASGKLSRMGITAYTRFRVYQRGSVKSSLNQIQRLKRAQASHPLCL
jgi:hypothetical protein